MLVIRNIMAALKFYNTTLKIRLRERTIRKKWNAF